MCPEPEEDSDTAGKADPFFTVLEVEIINSATYTHLCFSYKETLAPIYNSGGAGGPGGLKCSPCETTKLICQTPLCVTDETPCTFPTPVPEVKLSVPIETTGKNSEDEGADEERVVEDPSRGCGEPVEVSEEEEAHGGSRLLTGSCTCVVPVRQPLEVGENEDCSQAVSPGTPGICSCGNEGRKDERENEDSVKTQTGGDKSFGNRDRMLLSKSETSTAPLVSFSSPLTQSSIGPPLYELGSQSSQGQAGIEELDRVTGVASVGPKTTSPSDPALSPEHGQGLSCGDSEGTKLSSVEAQLECAPESLHSQLTEPNLTSGWSKMQQICLNMHSNTRTRLGNV